MKNVPALSSALSFILLAACGGPATDPADTKVLTPSAGGHSAAGGAATGGAAATAGKGNSGGMGVGGTGGSGATGGSAGLATGGSAGRGAGQGGTGPGGMTAGGSAGAVGASGGAPGGSGGAPVGGTAGAGGTGSGGMGGDSGGTTSCTITAMATASTAIPTVQTVTFTTTLTGITKAEIEFGTSGGPTMVAPVDLADPMYKTFLLGMKPSTSYVYRVKVTSPAGTCVGADQTIMTGALASAPSPTVTIMDAAKHDKGFIVLSSGLGGTSGYIIDPDGKTVWVAPSGNVPTQPSRVHLSWDSKRFYAMSLNVMNTSAGKIQSIAMDGTDAKTVSGTTASHHDFTAIPGGIATLLWNKSGTDAPCSLVEFPEGGAQKVIVADFSTIYTSNSYHTNAIHYYERDDSYTVGDRNPNLYAKLSRAGQLQWQFGGSSPKDAAKNFSGVTTWSVNHGHHLTADNQFVFFNNGSGNSSTAFVYKLDPATMKATQTAKLTGTNSMVLGDAQMLPNGNILISGSTTGMITEVTASGTVVMTIKAPSGQQFGYSEFRESLYGPPPY